MKRQLTIAVSLASLAWANGAYAQTTTEAPDLAAQDAAAAGQQAGGSGDPEPTGEVVVTAERRATSAQRTAVAATVFSAEDLEKKSITTVDDLQFAVPNLTVQNNGQGNQFNIRGIGKATNGNGVTVGVITYRDGVAVFPGFLQSEPYYDIQSVEVLRGPQGTFAGQNATGGAVFITETNPTLDRVKGYVQAAIGNFDYRRIQGAVNVPLSDTLAVRFAGNGEFRDTFYNISGPFRGDPGELRSISIRGSVLWEPSASFRVLAKADYGNIDKGGYLAEPVTDRVGDSLFDVANNAFNAARDEFGRFVLNANYTTDGGLQIRSITGYQEGTSSAVGDLDGTAALGNTYSSRGDEKIFSQEINLISPSDQRFGYVLGAYYQFDRNDYDPDTFVTGTPRFVNDLTLEGFSKRRNKAAFGQISYDVTDAFEVQAGARISRTTQRNLGAFTLLTRGVPVLRLAQDDENGDTGVTGKIALNWNANRNHFLYAFVATGYKSGGLNIPNLVAPARAFDPERVTDYEAGWKATWFGGRLRTQLGGFYNRYKNFQVTIADPDNPTVSPFLNIRDTSIIAGAELSGQASFGALSFDFSAAYLHTELGTIFAQDPRLPRTGRCNSETGPAAANCRNLDGNDQPYAPRFTGNIGVQYAIPLGGDTTLIPRVDYAHIAKSWTTIFANRALFDRLGQRNIVNAQLTLDMEPWTIAAYSTNLTDREYVTAINGRQQRFVGPPRQYGVRVTRNF